MTTNDTGQDVQCETPLYPVFTSPTEQDEQDKPSNDHNLNCPRSWRADDDTSFWQTYITEAEKYDKEMVDGWRKALDNLLVFSGLFSAVNTAFIIETYKLLQPDPAEDTAKMFRLFLQHRHDDHQFSEEELGSSSADSLRSAIGINSIFFASLSCSLLVAFGAVQGKDWLTQYDHNGLAAKPHSVQARVRQKKFDALQRWRFRILIAMLPLLLQISLALFLAGVIVFLWRINSEVAAVVMVFTMIGFSGFIVSWVIAVCHSSSPFQTPLSGYFHQPFITLLVGVRQLLCKIGSFFARTFPSYVSRFRWFLWTWQERKPGSGWFRTLQSECLNLLIRLINWMQEFGGPAKVRDIEEKTSAECVGWLFEQAEQLDVVLRTLNVASLLPPNHISAAFSKRVGLLERLALRYSSHVEERVGKKKDISNREDTIVTGIALFHVLKAQLFRGFREFQLALPDHRIRHVTDPENYKRRTRTPKSPEDVLAGSDGSIEYFNTNDHEVHRALAAVICCVEMLLPDSEGADTDLFQKCIKYISPESFVNPVMINIPTPVTHGSPSTTLTITVFPSGLLLDGIIACAVRHAQSLRTPSKQWGVGWFDDYHIAEILDRLRSVLNNEPSEETISHIAIVMAAVELARGSERRGLKRILSAWYVVDKRATVFKNIILAFTMAGKSDTQDQVTKEIYLSLLQFLNDYLPKGMEVSKNSEWTTWWPEAMKLYPVVLKFLSPIPQEAPLDDVLRVFARLLPNDWQYGDIQEALMSRYTPEKYPQLHTLNPGFPVLFPDHPDNCADIVKLIIRGFVDTPGGIMSRPQEVQDSVVELLGWIVAYPDAKDHLPYQIDVHEEYRNVPSFLLTAFMEKEVGPKTKTRIMACRHAARHLHALANMNAAEGSKVASQVKLDSLLKILEHWRLISYWLGDATGEDSTQVHDVIGLVIKPLRPLFKAEQDAKQRACHVGDSALKEMMEVWRVVSRKRESPERQFLLERLIVQAIVGYLTDHTNKQDLVSSESQTVDRLISYMEAARSMTQPEELQALNETIDSLNRVRQPWHRIFANIGG